MFKHRNIITAVDIGTSKICVIVGEADDQGNMFVLGHGESPSSESVCKGEIVNMDQATRALGCAIPEPFMALSFLALPVIPSLKLTDRGLVDVNEFKHVPLFV